MSWNRRIRLQPLGRLQIADHVECSRRETLDISEAMGESSGGLKTCMLSLLGARS